MSESKRKSKILNSHPLCCFCGGVRRSTTIDHTPARIFFRNKIGPEGFEFPACHGCNAESSLSEQIFGFYNIAFELDGSRYDEDELTKRISAIKNNAPECIPILTNSFSKKRQMVSEGRIKLQQGQFLMDVPIATIPNEVQNHFELISRKLLAALFYKETKQILNQTHGLLTHWDQVGSPAAEMSKARATDWFGDIFIGARRNTDIGAQFLYRTAYAHSIFGTWIQLGSAFDFFCVAGPVDEMATLKSVKAKPWVPIDQFGRAVKSGEAIMSAKTG